MSFPSPSEKDVRAIEDRFVSDISGFTPRLLDAARETFATITRPNWAFEWGLSRWAGEALGLAPDVINSLVLANVYMLAFGRILDDLVDGEHEPSANNLGHSALMTAALQHLWLEQYANLLADAGERGRRFWPYFRGYMSQWLEVLMPGKESRSVFRCYDDADWAKLAWQGAPLKVCCAAAALLADREHAIPAFAAAIDDIMVAVEMLDATFDWLGDLEAGRYNTFVAYCSDLPQSDEHVYANRRAVLEEVHLGKAGKPYFDLMCERLKHAADIAERVPCPGLSYFAHSLIDESRSCSSCMVEQATLRMNAAVADVRNRDDELTDLSTH